MTDAVLQDLRDWQARGDRRALGRAYVALQQEARHVVSTLEPQHTRASLRERVEEVVNALLFPADEGARPTRSTKLIPATRLRSTEGGRAYRRRVFASFVIDEQRAAQRHRELAQGASDPITAAAIREARRRRRQGSAAATTAQPGTSGAAFPDATALRLEEEHTLDRIAIRRAFDRISNPRYRVIIALDLGFDVTPFLPDLARRMNRDPVEFGAEFDVLRPGDADAVVRLFHPAPEPIESARENFGRSRRRALAELREALDEERDA